MSRRNIFFTRRISKSIKLLGPKSPTHRPLPRRKGRHNKSARMLWPQERQQMQEEVVVDAVEVACECGAASGTTYHSEAGQTDYCSCNDCGLLTQVG